MCYTEFYVGDVNGSVVFRHAPQCTKFYCVHIKLHKSDLIPIAEWNVQWDFQ